MGEGGISRKNEVFLLFEPPAPWSFAPTDPY